LDVAAAARESQAARWFATSEELGELADHAAELAEELSFEGPALRRRPR
jgi:hypothetical protein